MEYNPYGNKAYNGLNKHHPTIAFVSLPMRRKIGMTTAVKMNIGKKMKFAVWRAPLDGGAISSWSMKGVFVSQNFSSPTLTNRNRTDGSQSPSCVLSRNEPLSHETL